MARTLNTSSPEGVVNQGQQLATQRQIPALGPSRETQSVPPEFLRACRNEADAVNLCINLSGYSDETICDNLHIDKGHFSRIRKGRGHFPTRKRVALMQLCGNAAPVQYEAMQIGFRADRRTIADELDDTRRALAMEIARRAA